MLRTTLPAKTAVAYIVDKYRQLQGSGRQPATLRYFAAALTEVLQSTGLRVSHQSIKNWGDRRYLPDLYVMLQIAQQAQHDWRRDFALDILAAVEPDRYQPVSDIGRAALKDQKELSLSKIR
jgi:hypothetical protein